MNQDTDNITFFSAFVAKVLAAILMAHIITHYSVPFWLAAILIFIV